jgi:hypothetical protein
MTLMIMIASMLLHPIPNFGICNNAYGMLEGLDDCIFRGAHDCLGD